jgi:hypothetical protein
MNRVQDANSGRLGNRLENGGTGWIARTQLNARDRRVSLNLWNGYGQRWNG